MDNVCTEPECQSPIWAVRLCQSHYNKARRDRIRGGAYVRPPRVAKCIVEGCERSPVGQSLCRMHYERKRKGRPIGEPAPQRRASGEGSLHHSGYVVHSVGGKQILAHRHEMATLLGRDLLPKETVHHVNGDRGDNTTNGPLINFRSGNLELWSTFQPPGQRVEDKVQYALALLSLYRPNALSSP